MADVSEKLQHLSESDIVWAFRDSLVALLPVLQRLDCISTDTQPYDPFDRVAERLWEVLVLDSLKWKHGLKADPKLPRYGFSGVPSGADGHIDVLLKSAPKFRFIQFRGSGTGSAPFNLVEGVDDRGQSVSVPVSQVASFDWRRKGT